ncbi:MAG: hypothetical protein ABJD11_10685, partial [Gemmatimonadota bacterium]
MTASGRREILEPRRARAASPAWRLLVLAALLAIAGCKEAQSKPVLRSFRRPARSAPPATAAVIRVPTVVSFWLASADTIDSVSATEARSDFEYYTSHVADFLADQQIELVGTTADTIVVELAGGNRRTIMLSGLDYPFGYVLVQPGFAERILTGISTDEDLEDEASSYFDVGDDPDNGVEAGMKKTGKGKGETGNGNGGTGERDQFVVLPLTTYHLPLTGPQHFADLRGQRV